MIIKFGPKTISLPAARWPNVQLPFFKLLTAIRIPIPKAVMNLGGSTRAIALSLLLVAGGFAASFALVVHSTSDVPTWPEAGAVYALPNTNGQRLAPDASDPATRSQTLQINLANGVRLDKLHLRNLDLGKAGLDKSLYVTGVTGAQVDVGLITVKNSSAPTMDWSRINAGCIQIAGEMDGHTNAMTVDATIPNLVIDSDRGSGSYVAENSQVDRIIVQTTGGTATIGEILIDDVDASVGAWTWEGINAGCIVVEGNNKFGNGTGINNASVVLNNTVKSRSIVDNVVETPISVK